MPSEASPLCPAPLRCERSGAQPGGGLFNRVMGLARAVRRDGSAALDLCYVAAGRADGFWEEILKPWDMHAGRLILTEAGGKATRLDGTPLGLGPDGIVGTNGLIQDALVEALREEPSPALV